MQTTLSSSELKDDYIPQRDSSESQSVSCVSDRLIRLEVTHRIFLQTPLYLHAPRLQQEKRCSPLHDHHMSTSCSVNLAMHIK